MEGKIPSEAEREEYEARVRSLILEGYEDQAVAESIGEDGRRTVVQCWRHRGCEGLMGLNGPMEDECPHNRSDCYSPCPGECHYTRCSRPWHAQATDISLILDETIDRRAAVKRNCYSCRHFLKHAPKIGEACDDLAMLERFSNDGADGLTIHLY